MSIVLLTVFGVARSEESAGKPKAALVFDDATRTALVEQAGSLRERAATLKGEAESRFARDEAACYQKILSNDCRNGIKRTRSNDIDQVRKLESEARAIDRRVRQRDAVVHEEERRAALPQRAKEQAEQASRFHVEQRRAAQDRALRQAEKQKQISTAPPPQAHPPKQPPVIDPAAAKSRAQAHQQELAETQQRMADRDKRVAEKAAERAKKAAARAAGD